MPKLYITQKGTYKSSTAKQSKKMKKTKTSTLFKEVGNVIKARAEHKYKDTTLLYNTTAPSVVQTRFILINGIANGAGVNARVGNNIDISSIQISGAFSRSYAIPDPATRPNNDIVYCALVYDKESNKFPATISEVWNQQPVLSSIRNMDNSDRFQIIKQMKFQLSATSLDNNNYKKIEMYYTKNLKTKFVDGGDTTSSIMNGSLYFVISTSRFDTDDQKSDYLIKARIRYTDV